MYKKFVYIMENERTHTINYFCAYDQDVNINQKPPQRGNFIPPSSNAINSRDLFKL